jgi:hypothetical protein
MLTVLLSIGITSSLSIKEAVEISAIAEKFNAYGVWVGEDIDATHDIFAETAITLLRT